ncbi:hypothetical protein [Rufibacter immobilis]|uniref:hypothetical protein n=1 Tax=Rufibacter immobilis TaxID=1348778 RepID=UPI0035E9ADD1
MSKGRLIPHLHAFSPLFKTLLFFSLWLVAGPVLVQTIRYVKPGGTGNGSSWALASGDLQAMINASSANHQVWVAKGIYKPNRKADAFGTLTPNNRDNAFVLKADVKIYGGFTGTETQLAQRNSLSNPTVLSGDFNGDDVPGSFDKHIENAHHIVISVGNVGSAELSSFTITGGYAFGSGSVTVNGQSIYRSYGGGIFVAASSPGLSQLTVTANAADVRGGGINNQSNSSPRITHTTLMGNSATNGGAIYNRDSNPVISYITVSNNIGTFAGGVSTATTPHLCLPIPL